MEIIIGKGSSRALNVNWRSWDALVRRAQYYLGRDWSRNQLKTYNILFNLVPRTSPLPLPWSERGREEERPWERGCIRVWWRTSISYPLAPSDLINLIEIIIGNLRRLKNLFTVRERLRIGINFAAYFSAIISFAQIGQIFTIPQTQPLSSSYWSWRKTWQDNLRGLRVISRDLGPFYTVVLHELRWWHKDAIVVVGDDCVDQRFKPVILSTAPETPEGTVVNMTGDVSKQVNQFYGD